MSLADASAALRGGGSAIALDMLPFATLLDIVADRDGNAVTLTMPFHERLLGSPGRLHGGVVGSVLEAAALARLLIAVDADVVPALVTCTVNYLREGGMRATHAAATLTRQGRRVANFHAVAWQDDRSRPIAEATLNYLLDRGG